MLKNQCVRRVVTALFLIFGVCQFQQLRANEPEFQAQKNRDAKLIAFNDAYSKIIESCFKEATGNMPESFKSARKALLDAKALSEWPGGLKASLEDDNVDVVQFEIKFKPFLEELQKNFDASVKPPSDPTQPAPPGNESGSNSQGKELLAQVTDVDPLIEDESLYQLLLKFRDYYFPDGKPTTKNGFNKYKKDKQIETVQFHLQNHLLGEINKHSSDYKNKIKNKKEYREQWIKKHEAKIKEYAEQVVNDDISPIGDHEESIFLSHNGFKEELRSFIQAENKKLNDSTDQSIKTETVDQRKKRLTEAAIKFIQKELLVSDEHPINSIDDLDPISKTILEQYLDRYAKPLEPEHDDSENPTTKTGDNPRIAQHKAKIFEFLRTWMRVQSFISMFTGGFGLEEFFFNKIIEALETIVGGSLNSAEKTEVRAWAAELAREVPNQPGPVGIPPTIGYPTLVPVMPVNPVYIRPAGSGHHFRKHFP